MPIESNRINKECPECKNSTIFDTGKNYFCSKCLVTIPKSDSDIQLEKVVEPMVEPVLEQEEETKISDFSVEEKPIVVQTDVSTV